MNKKEKYLERLVEWRVKQEIEKFKRDKLVFENEDELLDYVLHNYRLLHRIKMYANL